MKTIEAGQGLHVSVFGGIPFVFPAAAALTEDQQADIGRARELVELGATAAATAILGHVERALGVTPEEHIVGVLAGEAQLAAERRKVQMAVRAVELQRAAQLNRAMAMPPLSDAVRLCLAQADEARARADVLRRVKDRNGRVVDGKALKVALADVRRHHDRASRLRREHLDDAWSWRAAAETSDLAWARGEDTAYVEVIDTPVLRISSRDGLATLFEAASITPLQYKAGRAFRVLYEMAGAGLKVATFEGGGGGGRSCSAKFNPKRSPRELQRALALGRLAKIEASISPVTGSPNRELIVLRWVAGEGRTLRSLTSGGRAFQANSAALKTALDTAAGVLWSGACESGSV